MRFALLLLLAGIAYAQPALQGLGASTYTCVDRDGDGYGVGTTCSPDADDLDATIHTGAQALAKYGTMQKFLSHRGYTPARIWLLSAGGSNTTGTSCTPADFETACVGHERITPSAIAADDLIMMRGDVNVRLDLNSGTSGDPVIVMSYPGEEAHLQNVGGGQGIYMLGKSWIVIDGQWNQCALNTGDSVYTENPHTNHDNIFRHIRGGPGCQEGIGPIAGGDRITIEDSVFHNNVEAGIYAGGTYNATSTDWIIRRNIAFGNGYDGIHWNGLGSGMTFEQNISYGNEIGGFSFQTGMTNSTVRSNLSFNNVSYAYILYNYKDNDSSCGAAPCGTGPQTGNVFENNTGVKLTETNYVYGHTNGCWLVANTSSPAVYSLGSNTYRNNICVNWGDLAATWRYAPIYFSNGATYFADSTFDHNLTWQASGINGGNAVFGLGPGTGGQSAENVYTCSEAQAYLTTGSVTNCATGDPKFLAADRSYWSTPNSYDLRLAVASPALHAGTATGVPQYDLKGRAFVASPAPSIGAIERQLYGNGWTDLGSTSGLRPAICPADATASSVCGSGGASCGGSGTPYPYQATCGSTIQSWSSAIARTKPGLEGLYLWGAGHTDGGNNSVYKLAVNTTSPAMTRVLGPSQITAADFTNCPSALGDGNPNTRHTYGQLAYLPTQDAMFAFSGSLYCGNGSHDSKTWWLDLPGLTWAAKDPVNAAGYNPAANDGGFVSTGACAYDPNSDGVYCNNFGAMLAYNPALNKYAEAYTGFYDGVSPSAVVDWHRRQWLQISNGHAYKVDIANGFSSSLAITDITASIDATCSTLMAAAGPGLVYNPVLDRIVGYPPNGGNTVYLMNPGDYTCTTQTFSGGPSNNTFGSPQPGTYGRFNYFPSLDVYAVVNGYNQNAFALNLNESDPAGATPSSGSRYSGTFRGVLR